MKKRGRTTSDTGTSFFTKQFSLSGNQNDVVTQPPKTSSTTSEISKLANSFLKTSTAGDISQKTESQKQPESTTKTTATNEYGSGTTSSPSNVLTSVEQENKYKPVTSFKSQERVNPFDKENKAASSSSTSTHSSISSSPSSGTYRSTSISESSEKKGFKETKIENTKFMDRKTPLEVDKKSTTFDSPKISSSNTSGIYSSSTIRTTPKSTAFSTSQSSLDSNYSTRSTEPVLDKPLYSRSESSSACSSERKSSDADLVFGDKKPYIHGSERLSHGGGSLTDADVIFGGVDKMDRFTSKYKSETSVLSKSMSVSSEKSSYNTDSNKPSYKIYEGIQNAAFQDFDSPTKSSPSSSSTTINRWNKSSEDNDLDLR